MAWRPTHDTEHRASSRSRGWTSTPRTVWTTARIEIRCERTRYWSNSARRGWSAKASTRHIAPQARNAPSHPRAMVNAGTRAPANMPPTGTPVCLMEKMSGARRGGQ